MHSALEFLSGATFIFGGVGLAIAVVLVLALFVLLPRGERRHGRVPAALLVLHVLVIFGLGPPPHEGDLQRALEVAAVFLLLACVARAGFVLGVDWFLAHRLGRPLPRIIRDIVQVLVYFGVAFLTLREIGVELGSLLATSALLTAVIGLSLQETLGNLFAGLAIQAQQPFRVGHWIHVEGMPDHATGRIIEINWRATKLFTNDRVEILIPNGLLAKSPIRNFSEPSPVSRRVVRVQGPYEAPPHRVEGALLEAAHGCPGVLADPPPDTWVNLYADSGIEYALVFFIDDFSSRMQIDSRVRRRIWYALQRAGIGIPFPIRDVRVHQVTEAGATVAAEERVQAFAVALRSIYFFEALPDEAFERLARAVEVRHFTAGEDIIRQGDPGSELFMLQRGSAEVLVQQAGGGTVTVAELSTGDVVGEISLVTGEARSATVRTTTPCECLVVGHEAFRPLLAENPDLAQKISEVLAARQAELASAQASFESEDRVTRSNVLLHRIKSFFSLWPGSNMPLPPKPR